MPTISKNALFLLHRLFFGRELVRKFQVSVEFRTTHEFLQMFFGLKHVEFFLVLRHQL